MRKTIDQPHPVIALLIVLLLAWIVFLAVRGHSIAMGSLIAIVLMVLYRVWKQFPA